MTIKSNYYRGLRAERIAKFWLQLKGYTIMEQRYRNCYGEIDLIVCKRKCLMAVEIKLRQTFQLAAESITKRQRLRIERTFKAYLALLSWHPSEIRFDVILMSPFKLPKHLKNAWEVSN